MQGRLHSQVLTCLTAAVVLGLPTSANAQTGQNLNPDAFFELLHAFSAAVQKPTFAVLQDVASGVTRPAGSAFLSVSGTNRRDGRPDADGSLAFGVGLGDARKTIGAEIVASITSTAPRDFGDSGSFTLKFSRAFPKGSVGLTVEYLVPWGDVVGEDVKTSLAWTTGHQFMLSDGGTLPVLFNFGIASATDYHDSWTPFAAVGLGLSDSLSLTAAHNGDYAILGASASLPRLPNMSFQASVLDLFDQYNDRRVTLSISYAINDLL